MEDTKKTCANCANFVNIPCHMVGDYPESFCEIIGPGESDIDIFEDNNCENFEEIER